MLVRGAYRGIPGDRGDDVMGAYRVELLAPIPQDDELLQWEVPQRSPGMGRKLWNAGRVHLQMAGNRGAPDLGLVRRVRYEERIRISHAAVGQYKLLKQDIIHA